MESEANAKEVSNRLKHELQLQRRTGIKVQLEFESPQWWTLEWLKYIERIAPAKQVHAAKGYVRSGKVIEMNVSPGLIEAKVQGRRKAPYHVRLYSPVPTDEQLAEIKRRLSEKAAYAALLLSGEMPVAVREIYAECGGALLPNDFESGQLLCSCPEPENICKHILAVLYVSGGVFDRDPFMLLRMRGLEKEDLLASLTVLRSAGSAHPAKLRAEATLSEPGPQQMQEMPFFCTSERPADPLPLDILFYGNEDLPQDLDRFRDRTPERNDWAGSHAPLFDFPLWRGETSFRDSIDPYYESVRKFLQDK